MVEFLCDEVWCISRWNMAISGYAIFSLQEKSTNVGDEADGERFDDS